MYVRLCETELKVSICLRGLLDFHFPYNLWFAICFMTVYGIVIALFKDLPDVEGDSKEDVLTLSVRLGVCYPFNCSDCSIINSYLHLSRSPRSFLSCVSLFSQRCMQGNLLL